MIKIVCNYNHAYVEQTQILTSGMVGTEISFRFSAEWAGLTKTAVFKAGDTQRDVLLTEDTVTIPWEVLSTPHEMLVVGVYGMRGADTVIPTIYARLGRIQQGADPSGDPGISPTPSVLDQAMKAADNADKSAKAAALSAENAAESATAAEESRAAAAQEAESAKDAADAAKSAAEAANADAGRAATLAEEVFAKASQTAQDATTSAQAKEAAQTAQRLADAAKQAAETAKQAAETAQAAVAQSAKDAGAAKQGAESALSDAQAAASEAAQAMSDIRALYQEMQTWSQGVIQTVSEAADSAGDSAVAAGNAADAARDAQKDAEAARDRAETAAIKQPYPNAETGTWWVWDAGRSVYSDSGEQYKGKTGDIGPAGANGKSAYASAQDGGYTGTEQEFNTALSTVGNKYEKPDNGIPKEDLDEDVKKSLEKANGALQTDGVLRRLEDGAFCIDGDTETGHPSGYLVFGSSFVPSYLLDSHRVSGSNSVRCIELKGKYFEDGLRVCGDVILTGIRAGTNPNDAVNKAQLDEKITAPATAAVGQIIRVKTVDKNGNPIEWEAVDAVGGSDLPDAGAEDKHKYLGIGVDSKWSVHPGQLSVVLDWYRNQDNCEFVQELLALLEERRAGLEEARANLEVKQAELQACRDEQEAKKDDFLEKYGVSSPDELDEEVRAEYDAMVEEGEALKEEAQAAVEEAQAAVDEAEALVNYAQAIYDERLEIHRQTEYALEACTEEMRELVLPPVTYADNGKTLQVVNGHWALV